MKNLCFLILMFLLHTGAKAQTADFTFSTSDNSFCSPQIVKFTAAASGTPVSYIWDFGDGLSGANAVQEHLYDYPGTYQVRFTAVYANSASSVTKSVIIHPQPVLTLTADKVKLCKPGTVVFTTGSNIAITGYEWNFNDGTPIQTTTTNNISHSFSDYGTFNVTVKAITANGCNSTKQLTIEIKKFPITVTVTPSEGCIPANSNLTATAEFPPGDALQNITWNFGDNTSPVTGNVFSVAHTYNITSTINTASVSIISNDGCTNQYTIPSFAFGIPPTNINAYTTALRDTFCGSETIQFSGSATDANSYTWDFGDGVIEKTTYNLITHKYKSLGAKTVTVTPYFNGCAGTGKTLQLFITGVIAAYTYSNTCSNKRSFQFTNNSLGAISAYEWTYSDMPGFIENNNYNPVHNFPGTGTFNTNLTVIDNVTGCRDSLSSTIYTATPVFTRNKNAVCKDSTVSYAVLNPFPSGSGYSYQLHINGNVINLGGTTSYDYNPPNYGNFNEYVVISDTLAGTCNDTLNLSTIVVRGPVVQFNIPALICMDTAVSFNNTSYPFFSADNIVKWKWDFGNGQKDSVKNPAPQMYTIPGQHIVKLEATDINGCARTHVAAVIIAGLPGIMVFPQKDTLCLGESATLMAYTADSLQWITNTNCNSCDTVTVSPVSTTDYIAMAITHNGCRSYDTSRVIVFGPFDLVASSDQGSVCPGTPVQLNLNVGGNITWSPGTFLSSTVVQNPIAIPDSSITYTVSVSDSLGCFADTAVTSIVVFDNPVVNAGPDLQLQYQAPFTLSPEYSAGIQLYNWTPSGELSCSNCATPSGIANERQEYVIQVIDNNNCTSKDSVIVYISCEKSNLLLPTAFTPNGDGLNDKFYPSARGYRIIKSFSIFNRNGNKVFERKNFQPNNSADGWDGKIKNSVVDNMQSYVWIIEGICDTGTSIITKGSVILLK